ncbi:MAG: class I SAM-dependent methyltransferase, partial [Proteobacteria bacterium]|nr:class I SAM-dependent methyltransferase [Pseudomonadota bacterium]
MKRVPEPELMDEDAQARAYASANFEAPHSQFIELFRETFPDLSPAGMVLDLGCGPADITLRFAQAFPACRLQG